MINDTQVQRLVEVMQTAVCRPPVAEVGSGGNSGETGTSTDDKDKKKTGVVDLSLVSMDCKTSTVFEQSVCSNAISPVPVDSLKDRIKASLLGGRFDPNKGTLTLFYSDQTEDIYGNFLTIAAVGRGTAGKRGPAGNPGKDGKDGANGKDGEKGPPGGPGPAGEDGMDGEDGMAGPTGSAGAAGAAGPPGPAGVAGVVGPVGPVGPAGPRGTPGPDGKNGANYFVNGTPGTPGINATHSIILRPTAPTPVGKYCIWVKTNA